MSSHRPLPALALVLPHPQLPTSRSYSPRTPRACTPSTPFAKQLIVSPRNSIDSWGSSAGNAEDDSQWEWKPEQIALLVRALDAVPGHLYTPFNGPVPPSNLLDQIARRVLKAHESLEWPHSIRATRTKLAEIARASDKENMTIEEVNEEEEFLVTGDDVVQVLQSKSKRPALPKRPLYRQSSMEFLPVMDKTNSSLLRLSTRLQRADRIIPTYHPYARPSSRSPSPPNYVTLPRHVPQSTTMVLRPRPIPGPLGTVPFPKTLRRSISTLSNPVSNTDGSVRPPSRIRRADSFSFPAPTTLKRAPSFGGVTGTSINNQSAPLNHHTTSVVTVNTTVTSPLPEKLPQDPETDDEEKVRQNKAKRPRTKSSSSSRSGTPEKKKKAEVSLKPVDTASSSPGRVLRSRTVKPASPASGENMGKPSTAVSPTTISTATKPTVSSAAKQRVKVKAATAPRSNAARPTRPRVEVIFGPELPAQRRIQGSPVANLDVSSLDPSKRTVLPSAPSPTRTLRRVKTTLFNAGIGRRISFGSLPVPSGNIKDTDSKGDAGVGIGLGSAFELSQL